MNLGTEANIVMTSKVGLFFILMCTVFKSQFWIINSHEEVSVQIGQAVINGVIEGSTGQRHYYAFKGIEYGIAERWNDPVLKELVEKGYNASKFAAQCPQWDPVQKGVVGKEKCLYLNIFISILPQNRRARDGEILNPVLFYIHGGGYVIGSGENGGPGHFMSSKKQVVLVTINSRLGVFGYLSTGEEDLAGNWGILDLLTALEWVHKYIEHFGGDPNRITIFGHSSGAALAHILSLSPLTAGKVYGAILHSGNGLCEAHLEKHPLKYAEKVAASLQCPTEPRSELIKCLRNQSTNALIKSQVALLDFWIYPKHCSPVIDGSSRGSLAVLPDNPSTLVNNMKVTPVPIIIGVNNHEGLFGFVRIHEYFGYGNFRNSSFFSSKVLPHVLRVLLKIQNDEDIQTLLELVQENYFKNLNMTDIDSFQSAAITGMSNLIGDVVYYSCKRNFLELYSRISGSPVYSYVFSHKTSTSPSIIASHLDKMRKQNISHHLFDVGVPHMEDALYLFGPNNFDAPGTRQQVFSLVDEGVAAAYLKSVITFAKNGFPVPSQDPKHAWLPLEPGTLHYFNFTSMPVGMGLDFKKQESLFWLKTVPNARTRENYTMEVGEILLGGESTLNSFPIFWVAITMSGLLLIPMIFLGVIVRRKW